MKKVFNNADDALTDILQDDIFIAAGGFGLCGIPELLLNAIKRSGVSNLTFASNNAGVDDFGIGILLKTKQVKKMIIKICCLNIRKGGQKISFYYTD